MTVYPNALDTDTELPRVDDDLTDFSSNTINAIREALFAIEKELGINPRGTKNSIVDFLLVAHNPNGTLKESALSALGLVTLPIDNAQIGSGAGIEESKLNLNHSTVDLYTIATSNETQILSIISFLNSLSADFLLHLSGAIFLSNGITSAKHTAEQILLSTILFDKDGNQRVATNVGQALNKINEALTDHENAVTLAHVATAINVDTENFEEIPVTANTAQKVFDYLDDAEVLNLGQHRAIQHANGIPKIGRSESFANNGYGNNIVPSTLVTTYLVTSPNTNPVDSLSNGDDLVSFISTNTNKLFDSQFSQVKVGDIIRINYGNGIEATFPVESIRFTPGSEWIVRLNGVNLANVVDGTSATARIDRPNYDVDVFGILATAPVNIRNATVPIYTDILTSLIVADPKSATALGLGFDPGQINSSHYKLYIEFYPTGNPIDKTIALPFIDVSGNAGATPGKYTLESIVQTTNDKFREIGYNFRLIAFAYNGEFGLSLADSINGVSFAVISGTNSSGTLATGIYTDNVIGGNSVDSFDALGFGTTGSNVASPAFQNSWSDSTAALLPTKIISPLKKRYYFVNGKKKDEFAKTFLANSDGSWDGYISNRNPIGSTNVETTYTILLDLKRAGLRPGKTIVVQPVVEFSDPNYSDIDYGRFIIKTISFDACAGSSDSTVITVVNSLHATGNGFGFSSGPSLNVKLFFSQDSVDFDDQNIIDTGNSATNYGRFYEVYINDEGKTFSHERARFQKQTETVSLLGSTNWHLINVSSKLRGYRESNPLMFNKFIRLFITNYNSTSGEFDGYVGQKNGSGISKIGIISTGRKNIPIKFYDESGIDYVELIFKENNSSPGIDVLSTSAGRYLDIELFSSLQLQDELMLLSTCETTWGPNSNEDIVQYVIDRRQFGSIDELDFTDSAKDYINAGNKYIHQNGVVRGFELSSINNVVDSGEIYFQGGLAFVNGKIITANNYTVTIPRTYPTGSSLPQNVIWAVCVNDFGNLIPKLITTVKDQYFATPSSGNYYLESYTFDELVNTRKDLLPIYLVTATVGSLSISSTSDVRKFIVSQDSTVPLTLFSNGKTAGNFYTFEALKAYINASSGTNQKVQVRGEFTKESTEDPYDLTDFTKKVIFDGENSVFNIASKKGFLIGSNVTLRNFTVNYSGSNTSYTSGALLNYSDNNACFVNELSSNIENVCIENCTFNYLNDTQRPPFISFGMQKGQIIKNLKIENNYFNDIGTTLIKQSQAAIAVYTNNSGALANPALAFNIEIKNNICNQKQGIYLTTVAGATGAESPGLNAINCNIEKNICGIIGVVTSGKESTLTGVTNIDVSTGVSITNNSCSVIGNFYDTGNKVVDVEDLFYGIGSLEVKNNKTHWIFLQNLDIAASGQYSSLQITNNILTAFDATTYLALFSPTLPNYAIYVAGYSSTDTSYTLISGNSINFGRYDSTTYTYLRGVSCDTASIITENIIRGLGTGATGIQANGGDGASNKYYNISDNQIYRGTVELVRYIQLPASGTKSYGICKNNFFDSYAIFGADGSSEITIGGSFNQWVVESNINQTKTFRASSWCGKWGTSATASLAFGDFGGLSGGYSTDGLGIYVIDASQDPIITYSASASGVREIVWAIHLDEILPKDSYVTEISVDLESTATFLTSSFILSLFGTGLATKTQPSSPTTVTNAGQNLLITVGNRNYIVNDTVRPIVKLSGSMTCASSNTINITSFTIKYRW